MQRQETNVTIWWRQEVNLSTAPSRYKKTIALYGTSSPSLDASALASLVEEGVTADASDATSDEDSNSKDANNEETAVAAECLAIPCFLDMHVPISSVNWF